MISNKWYKINNHKLSCISRAQGAKGTGIDKYFLYTENID